MLRLWSFVPAYKQCLHTVSPTVGNNIGQLQRESVSAEIRPPALKSQNCRKEHFKTFLVKLYSKLFRPQIKHDKNEGSHSQPASLSIRYFTLNLANMLLTLVQIYMSSTCSSLDDPRDPTETPRDSAQRCCPHVPGTIYGALFLYSRQRRPPLLHLLKVKVCSVCKFNYKTRWAMREVLLKGVV